MEILLLFLLVLNLVTFTLYGVDKYKATKKQFRIKESTLLILAYAGGGIGASMAMNLFRHKTQHKSFTIGVPVAVIFNIAVYTFLIIKLKLV